MRGEPSRTGLMSLIKDPRACSIFALCLVRTQEHSHLSTTSRPSPDIDSPDAMTLNLQPLELWERNVRCLSHLVCGILLYMAAWTKSVLSPLIFNSPINDRNVQSSTPIFLFFSSPWFLPYCLSSTFSILTIIPVLLTPKDTSTIVFPLQAQSGIWTSSKVSMQMSYGQSNCLASGWFCHSLFIHSINSSPLWCRHCVHQPGYKNE